MRDNLTLTQEQNEILKNVLNFVHHRTHKVCIIKGYAGTGKTSLICSIIDRLQDTTNLIVTASTGRAAHILSKKIQQFQNVIGRSNRLIRVVFPEESIGIRIKDYDFYFPEEKEEIINSLDGKFIDNTFVHIIKDNVGQKYIILADSETIAQGTTKIISPFFADVSSVWIVNDFNYQSIKVKTLHSALYDFIGVNQEDDEDNDSNFLLKEKRKDDYKLIFKPIYTEEPGVIIVDEASMISDRVSENSFSTFGSGNVVEDLFKAFPNYQFIFVGDATQLPPVNQDYSPLLSSAHLEKNYNVSVTTNTLTKIVRQDENSGIIMAAQKLRDLIERNIPLISSSGQRQWPQFPLRRHDNIQFFNEDIDLINAYIRSIKDEIQTYNLHEGLFQSINNQIFICLSNKECFNLNRHIRQQIFPEIQYNQSKLQPGEILQVTQNTQLFNLNNGDLIQVLEIGEEKYFANMKFIQLVIRSLSDNREQKVLLLYKLLESGHSNISMYEQKQMMRQFIIRMKTQHNLDPKKNTWAFNEMLRNDPYMNAVRAIYGYSITCHKAQGGEWNNVYIYAQNNLMGIPKPYNWMYTAITRAKECVYLSDKWFFK